MSIKQGGPLSSPQPARTRTDFTKPRGFAGMNLTSEERTFYEFIAQNKADIAVFLQCKSTAFFRDWLKKSVDEYKDLLAMSGVKINEDVTRGMIQGQKEISAMFDLIERLQNKKQEARKNGKR